MLPEKRKHARIDWLSPGAIYLTGDSTPISCVVSDLSSGGSKIGRVDAKMLPNEFTLDVWPGNRCTRLCQIIWRSQTEVGVKFVEPLPTSEALAGAVGETSEKSLQDACVDCTRALTEPD